MTNALEFVDLQPPLTDRAVQQIVDLSRAVFGQADPQRIAWRIEHMPDLSCFLAIADGAPAGFKIGYALSQERYYSWLGGVHPAHRRRGIAARLMVHQHAWALERGYRSIETATEQQNVAMARVNLSHGFQVCGLRTFPDRTQILFAKQLG